MTKLNKGSVIAVSQNQVSAELTPDQSGSLVIMGLNDGVYYELTDVGAIIWRLIQQPRSIQSIIDALLTEYDVSTQQCLADVLELTEDMLEQGLIEIQDEQNS